jgi:hypothetical protein
MSLKPRSKNDSKYCCLKFTALWYIVSSLFVCQLWSQNSVPLVTNVTTLVDAQNHVVTISYDLWDDEDDSISVSLKISDDNGLTYLFTGDSAVGDNGYPVFSGTDKQIHWYCDPETTTTFKAKIVADDFFEIDVADIIAGVDSLNLFNDLLQIEGIRHRTAGIEHLEFTKTFIEDRFTEHGLFVTQHEFIWGAYEAVNLIGKLPGQHEEEIVFIVDGHFDTVWNSPGAADNGSGVVGMLEAMRVLSVYNFNHTIKFISFDLEEAGLIGSGRYVSEALLSNEQIEGVINFDNIGYIDEAPGSQTYPSGFELLFPDMVDSSAAHDHRGDFIANFGNHNSSDLKSQFDYHANLYVPELRVLSGLVAGNGEIAPDLRRSDHASFWDAGYKAIWLCDSGDLRAPYNHTPGDTTGTLNFQFMANIVKATVATMATMAEVVHCGITESEPFEVLSSSVYTSNYSIPGEFSLHENYPNPFNPTTTISYDLSEQSTVSLTIYDVRGQEIVTLQNGVKTPGNYQVQWNGMDHSGNPMSTGVYFCRLEAGSYSKTIKMLYLR